jgi:hypothetical protein
MYLPFLFCPFFRRLWFGVIFLLLLYNFFPIRTGSCTCYSLRSVSEVSCFCDSDWSLNEGWNALVNGRKVIA